MQQSPGELLLRQYLRMHFVGWVEHSETQPTQDILMYSFRLPE
jgi:hypothetical protein